MRIYGVETNGERSHHTNWEWARSYYTQAAKRARRANDHPVSLYYMDLPRHISRGMVVKLLNNNHGQCVMLANGNRAPIKPPKRGE